MGDTRGRTTARNPAIVLLGGKIPRMRKVRTIPTVVLAGWFVWATGCSTPADAPPPAQPPTPAASATAAAPAPAADSHASMHDLAATPVPGGVQAMLTISPDLPPLPSNALNGARPLAQIKAAYEFAARHPEVLKYMPCFCGCERAGHKATTTASSRSATRNGRVTEWVPHGDDLRSLHRRRD